MSKSGKVMKEVREAGILAGEKLAQELGINLFAVDAGPGSRVEVWNKAWTKLLAYGAHVSKYDS